MYDPGTHVNRTIELDQYVGAVVPTESGKLMLALQHGFYTMDLNTEQLTKIVDPEEHLPDNRFNDGKCDVRGRFWAEIGRASCRERVDVVGVRFLVVILMLC